MTEAERRLWARLRAHRLGPHFRRQHPIDNRFIVDFYCAKERLCIEIDGDRRTEPQQLECVPAPQALEYHSTRENRFTIAGVMHRLDEVLKAIQPADGRILAEPRDR